MKKLTCFAIVFCLVISWNISSAQNIFIKRYVAPGGHGKIFRMPDRSLTFIGDKFSPWWGVTQVDSSGNPLWAKHFYPYTEIVKVRQDNNKNWFCLTPNGVMKMDSSFNVLWIKQYIYNQSQFDIRFEDFVFMENDSSLFITGKTYDMTGAFNTSLLFMKINSNGNVQWAKYFDAINTWLSQPFPTQEKGTSIQKLNNGNMIIGGFSDNDTLGIQAMALFQVDVSGNMLSCTLMYNPWCAWPVPNCDMDQGIRQIEILANGDMLLGGQTFPYGGGTYDDIYLVKTDSLGNKIWSFKNQTKKFVKFIINPDSTIYLGSNLSAANQQPSIDKISPGGQQMWHKIYSDINFGNMTDLIASESGGFTATGGGGNFSFSFIIEADSSGFAGCLDYPSGNNLTNPSNHDIFSPQSPYNSFSLSFTETIIPFTDSLYSFTQHVYCGPTDVPEILKPQIEIYPNPSQGQVFISSTYSPVSKVEIFNMLGEKVISEEFHEYSITLDASVISPGIYIISITSGKEIYQEKLVLK